ncbi:arg8-vasotocin receptor-like [Mytilus trossulus]|uniref:arg8-vasotocin receptor-like n=1 Tax=Mytilus trossulus TaxID=6551 RepID=UPI0030041666
MDISTTYQYNITNYSTLTPQVDMFNTTEPSNKSTNICENVHDKKYDETIRRASLYVMIIIGTLGGIFVLLWMWNNRRLNRRMNSLSRVNSFILNLTVADLMVVLLAILPQLIWEYQDQREWHAGAFMCKFIKFLQSFTMMASTNVVVVIAIDRHLAIRAPLKKISVWKMSGCAWTVAVVASLPMFYVFRLVEHGDRSQCENIFRTTPKSHRQAFLTYIGIIVFVIPFVILIFCYTRIFLKIARKARESRKSRQVIKPGKIHLQSTQSSSLPKAKVKTLKMTFVIVAVYAVCGLPYFIAEMIMSYGDHCVISPLVYGLLGSLAVANSTANPYVFLLFNTNCKMSDLRRGPSDGIGTQKTCVYSTTSTRSFHDSKTASVNYKWSSIKDNHVELSNIR